jgi:hypothetical protein
MRLLPIVLATTIIVITAAAEAQVTAHLEVIPDHLVPGIPPSFVITIHNGSAKEVILNNAANLNVTPASGGSFFAEWDGGHSSEAFSEDQVPLLRLPPNATHEIALPVDVTLVAPMFFVDSRLTVPGRYIFAIHLYSPKGTDDNEDIASNGAAFVVDQPNGADLAVWNQMQLLANGRWTSRSWSDVGFAVARQVVTNYQTSKYFAYVALFNISSSNADALSLLQQAVATKPAGPIADLLQLGEASVHGVASNDAFKRGDIDTAVSEEEAARSIVERVMSESMYSFVRRQAASHRALLKSQQQLRGFARYVVDHAPPAPQRVTPYVECVDKVGDGRLVARFGYRNPNNAGKRLAAGTSANRFSPGPADQGQPGYFYSGQQEHVASAAADEESVSWDLDGETAKATRDMATCTQPADAIPVRPIIDCVKRDEASVVVSFGYDNANAYALVVPAGLANSASPAGDEKPPTLFLAGVHHNVWSVRLKNGTTVTWTLGGLQVAGDGQSGAKCLGGNEKE